MNTLTHMIQLRVRYGETDQMGTFYNARALDWFECARTELMRQRMSISYAQLEEKGFYLPVTEAHLVYDGPARYDDLLTVRSAVGFLGRARLRFEVRITQAATERPVVSGYTIHGFINREGKPLRPPPWFVAMFDQGTPGTASAAG